MEVISDDSLICSQHLIAGVLGRHVAEWNLPGS